jgi:hypothetical protein
MKLNLSIFNSSDRLVAQGTGFRVANSWKKFMPYWLTDSAYTNENRRAIQVFRESMVSLIGTERLGRICAHYSIDLDSMYIKGQSLNTRTVAHIFLGIKDVRVEDVQELAQEAKRGDKRPWVSDGLYTALRGTASFKNLTPAIFAEAHQALATCVKTDAMIPLIQGPLSGAAKSSWSGAFNQFEVDRERLQLVAGHDKDDTETFIHNMSVRVIKRELNVGMLIPAPNGHFYRVAAKIVTGQGHVSYVCAPAVDGTELKTIRFFRGTSLRRGEIDAISSLITDSEVNLGQMAFRSGREYEAKLRKAIPNITVYAGHSLGAAIASKGLLYETVEEAYLFNGPGLRFEEVAVFNQKRKKPITLHIRHAEKDRVSNTGERHLGFEAKPAVTVDYARYEIPKGVVNRHVFVPNKPDCTKFPDRPFSNGNGYQKKVYKHSKVLDNHFLSNASRAEETFRVRAAPFVSWWLKNLRDNFRGMFGFKKIFEIEDFS